MKTCATSENTLRLMLVLLILGVGLLLCGLYMVWYTPAITQPGGITIAVLLISFGLLLLIPAKVYLILRLMARKSSPHKKP